MRATIAALAILFASQAHAAMAMHTGKMMAATSIGGQLGWNCEYQYMNQRFWMFFTGYCPPSVQVN